MDKDIEATIEELRAAVEVLDRKRVDELCDDLIEATRYSADPFPLASAKQVLGLLRRKRFFLPMQRVADAVIQSEQPDPSVRRQYAQALIDQGALTAGAAVLLGLVDDPAERTEVRGLLGRVYKQRFVEGAPCTGGAGGSAAARNAEVLRQAIRYYYEPFLESPEENFWHGINAVALAARARRDGLPEELVADPDSIGREVLARIRARGKAAGAWELATALEACVALGDEDAAIGRAVKYTEHPDADAFEIASTLRQLQEVWCLDSTGGMGEAILPLLRGALLRQETGSFAVTPAEVREAVKPATVEAAASLEKVFGADAFTSYETYLHGARRARTVARIGREVGGRSDGTGFLIRGADLAERFRDEEWLLVTNAHVISTQAEHEPAIFPDEAVVTFQGLSIDSGQAAQSYGVEEVLGVSGPRELDFAVLKLNGRVAEIGDQDRCELASRLPVNNQKGRVYIIGHPGGGSLSYSIQDNLLLDYDESRLHYRTPTEGGSSGSPVYNARWQLIGLHHAGSREMPRLHGQSGSYEANEGIWIQAIRTALER
jgi:hypothetical protein